LVRTSYPRAERGVCESGDGSHQHDLASTADVRDVLPSVQAPALVLRQAGVTLPGAAIRYVAELLPHASYEELPETDSMSELSSTYQRRGEEFIFGARGDVRRIGRC
jgi:hypothetical protein